jgi:hypothetical protein
MQGMVNSGLSVSTLDQKRRLMIDARVKTAFHGRCMWKGKTGVMPVEQIGNINVPSSMCMVFIDHDTCNSIGEDSKEADWLLKYFHQCTAPRSRRSKGSRFRTERSVPKEKR